MSLWRKRRSRAPKPTSPAAAVGASPTRATAPEPVPGPAAAVPLPTATTLAALPYSPPSQKEHVYVKHPLSSLSFVFVHLRGGPDAR